MPRIYTDEYITKLDTLPAHMRDGVRRWIEEGRQSFPGDFLTALLKGDLFEAYGRADDENARSMRAYVIYFFNYAPAGCYGSPEKFENWKGLRAMGRLS